MKRIVFNAFAPMLTAASIVAALDYTPSRYQQLDYFGGFGGNTPLFINPGNITDADQVEVMFGYYSTIKNNAGLTYISGVYPFGLRHTIGASFFLNGSTVDNVPDGQSGVFRKDAVFLGYGYRLLHGITLGANLSMLNFNNFGTKNLPVNADFGVLFNPIQNSRMGFLKMGASIQNAFPYEAYDNTTNLNFGVHWLGLHRRLEMRSEVGLIDILPQDASRDGMVPAWAVGGRFFVTPNVALGMRQTREGFPMLSFSGNAKRLGFLRYLELELDLTHDGVAFMPDVDQKRGLLWNIRTTARFGPTREEVLGSQRYARLIREPEIAFQEAMRLYLQRRFLEAAYAFGRVVVRFPTFHRVPIATFYQGRSFENLRMNEVARRVYRSGIDTYHESEYVAKYYFQLLNIAYKERRWAEAQSLYTIITNQFGQSDVRADADYVMGQVWFAQDQFSRSRPLLEGITAGDANHSYARYTLGLIATRENKLDEAVGHFESILTRNPRNRSERALQEAAAVKLGHVLYSLPSPQLTRAAELYGQVGEDSEYYDEAQLAMAWVYVRNERWEDAANFLQNILRRTPNSILIPEVHLVRGYSLMQRGELGNAVQAFDLVLSIIDSGLLTEQQIREQGASHTESMRAFPATQERAYQLSLQLPSERVLKHRAELQPSIDAALRHIEENFLFQDRLAKQRRFQNDRSRIRNDAEYAKATATRLLLEGGAGGGGNQEF